MIPYAIFRMTAHDICANSTHDPVCEQLTDAHDIYANNALAYANDLCKKRRLVPSLRYEIKDK